jgi:hypothetical protein
LDVLLVLGEGDEQPAFGEDVEPLLDHVEFEVAVGVGGGWVEDRVEPRRQVPQVRGGHDLGGHVLLLQLILEPGGDEDVHLKAGDIPSTEGPDQLSDRPGRAHGDQYRRPNPLGNDVEKVGQMLHPFLYDRGYGTRRVCRTPGRSIVCRAPSGHVTMTDCTVPSVPRPKWATGSI